MENQRAVTRALTKLAILGLFAFGQLPWTGLSQTISTLLFVSALLDAAIAVDNGSTAPSVFGLTLSDGYDNLRDLLDGLVTLS